MATDTDPVDLMKEAYEAASKEYDRHLRSCDTCNYDQNCMECEIGDPEETDDNPRSIYQVYVAHNCGCSKGSGQGAYLRRITRELWDQLDSARKLADPLHKQARKEFNESRQNEVTHQLASWLIKTWGLTVRDLADALNDMVRWLEDQYKTHPVRDE